MTPDIAAGEWRPLDPRYVDLQRQVGWITKGVIAALAAVGIVVSFLMTGGSPIPLSTGTRPTASILPGWRFAGACTGAA